MTNGMPGSLLAFAVTCFVVEITPGPNMAYLATLSLARGIRTGLAAVAGVALGLSIYGLAASLGLAALIAQSVILYEALRWAGVLYLLYLAWEAWTADHDQSPASLDGATRPTITAFSRGLLTNLLNPKAAIFYIAVTPEFVSIEQGSVALQTLRLSAIYVAIATLIHAGIVLLASSGQRFSRSAEQRRTISRIAAILLAGIALWFGLSTARD